MGNIPQQQALPYTSCNKVMDLGQGHAQGHCKGQRGSPTRYGSLSTCGKVVTMLQSCYIVAERREVDPWLCCKSQWLAVFCCCRQFLQQMFFSQIHLFISQLHWEMEFISRWRLQMMRAADAIIYCCVYARLNVLMKLFYRSHFIYHTHISANENVRNAC